LFLVPGATDNVKKAKQTIFQMDNKMENQIPLRKEFDNGVTGLMETSTKIEQRLLLLEEKEKRWSNLVKVFFTQGNIIE
jgi:hypothetical protein